MRRNGTRLWPWLLRLTAVVVVVGVTARPVAAQEAPPTTRPVAARVVVDAPSAPAANVEVLYGALILATRHDDPDPQRPPAELPPVLRPLARQLGVFGYNQFQVIGEKQANVPTGTEDWLVPSRQFFLRVDTRGRLPEGDGYDLALQLFQRDRPLTTVDCRLRRDRPLFIRGPMVGAGQLIILLRVM